MSFVQNIISKAKAAVVGALVLVLWMSGSAAAFFVRAHDKGADAHVSVERVYFRVSDAAVSASYMGNAAVLETIDSLATLCAFNGVSALEITSYSSIEGRYSYNETLSERRANALRDYIVEMHPLLRNRISINVQAESWGLLRSSVLKDSRLSSSEKDDIIEIIDSADEPDTREARLKQLPSYGRLFAAYFKTLRYAEVRFIADPSATPATESSDTAASATAAGDGSAVSAPADSSYARADANSSEASSEASQNASSEGSAVATAGSAVAASADTTAAAPAATAAADSAASAAVGSEASESASSAASAAAPRSAVASGVHFPLSGTSVEPDHAANSAALAAIANLLESNNPEDVDSVVVTSGCSIDGTVAHNSRVSRERGNALVNWIADNYPEYKSKLVLDSRGEDWDALREAVASDSNLSAEQKNEALDIIDSKGGADRKEAALRGLDSWSYLQESILPQTRYAYARIALVSILKPEESPVLIHPELTVELEDSTDILVQPNDTLVVADSLMQVDTIAYVREIPAEEQPAVADTVIRERAPLFALTTNLLYTSATVFTGFHSVPLTIGVEVPVGQHWSVYSNYMATAPWRAWDNNAECAELIHLDLGAKWYPGGSFYKPFVHNPNREVLDGWYAYGAVGAGYYDFERNGKGYQGEEILGTLGLGYGLNLGKNWSLDFALGVGPMFTQYRYYIARNNNQYLAFQYSGTMQYFGVTDAKVTLRYMLHYNRKVKSQNK